MSQDTVFQESDLYKELFPQALGHTKSHKPPPPPPSADFIFPSFLASRKMKGGIRCHSSVFFLN